MDANRPFSGFIEVPHIADVAIDVFAPSFPQLFKIAANGLYHILGVRKGIGSLEIIQLTIEENDGESLLVAFLNELLYYVEQNKVAADIDLDVNERKLHASLQMAAIQSIDKEMKAVTYNQMKITKNEKGYQTRIVFDL